MQTYHDAVLNSIGLVGYWRLGEANGSVARDITGKNPGSFVASPTQGAGGCLSGSPSQAVLLNGSTQYVTIPDSASLDLGDSLSVAVWTRRTDSAGSETLAAKGANAWHLNYQDPGVQLAIVRSGVVVLETSASIGYDTAVSHFAVGVKVGTDVRMYHDGRDVSATLSNSTLTDTAVALEFGRNANGGTALLNGVLGPVALWNRALTAQEVAHLYRLGRGF